MDNNKTTSKNGIPQISNGVNKFFKSKIFKAILWCLAGLIVFLFIFKAGLMVGFKKANFSYRWGENYHRNFAGPRGGFFKEFARDLNERDFIGGHGVFGQIMNIGSSTLAIRSRDNVEKIVLIKDNTVIERFRDAIKAADLKVNDYIIVIGEPNSAGQIEAEFIRLAPPPPMGMGNMFEKRI